MAESDVEKGMVCAVLFTIGFYKTTPKEAINVTVARKTAGLNIQGIVVLDKKNPDAAGNAIGDHPIALADIMADVQEDPTLSLEQAIVPNAVAQAPVAIPDANEEMI